MTCIVCGKKLRVDNTIGTCREHRSKSPVRREYEKSWQQDNEAQYKAAKNAWTRNNPEYFAKYRNSSITRKLAHALRTRIRRAVKFGSAVQNLGCSIEQFKLHLERNFEPGMTWNNYGEWHIDHIKPLISFDLTDEEQLKKACNYKNMQPLWRADNSRKHAKLDYTPKSA